MKIFLLIVAALIVSFTVWGQPGSKAISGLVKDIQNQPVPGATVQLLRSTDSTVLLATTAGNNGKFAFHHLHDGIYLISITALGHQPYTGIPLTIDDSHASVVLPVIVLKPKQAGALKEVTVTARKPLIEQDLDKTIVNVEAMISAATGTALEVLEKTPGVTVGSDGSISLHGQSGVVVLIDGRQTHLSGQDLANYLRSLPGGMLDKLELMPNPPAKYDAAGGSVINIRMKKSKMQGYFGNFMANYSQGKTSRSNDNFTLNYNRNKLNIFGSIGYNKDGNRADETYHRTLLQSGGAKTSDVFSQTRYTYSSHSIPVRFGMDYTLSPKTTAGFVVNYNSRRSDEQWNYNSSNFDVQGGLDSAGTGYTNGYGVWRQKSLNVNALHAFDKSGRELSADLNYIQYTNDGGQDLQNFLGDQSGAGHRNEFLYVLPSQIDVYNAKADYSLPLQKGLSLSAGYKWSLVKNNSQSDYYAVINNNQEPDYGRSNHFLYDEQINAAYVNARKDWKRFGMQLGLRTENTSIKGHQLGNAMVNESAFSRNYTGLFPSAFFSYKLDSAGKKTFTINYSRRVNRPWYNQLNPFLFYRDQYSYSTGNPYLDPAYQTNLILAFRYKQWLTLSAMYNGRKDVVLDIARAEGNVFITKPENLAGGHMLAMMANINWSHANWWNGNLNCGVARFVNEGVIDNELIEMARYACKLDAMSQFKFKKNWGAEIVWQFTSRMINWQRIIEPRYRLNAAVQKKIFRDKGSIKLSMDDIFYWMKEQSRYVGLQQATAIQIGRYDTQRVGLAFNYNFGKETFARKRRHTDNAADDVKGRVE